MSDLKGRTRKDLMKSAQAKKKVFAPPLSKMNKQQLINYIEGTKAPSFKRSDYKAPPSAKQRGDGGQMRPKSKMKKADKSGYKGGKVNKNARL